MNKRKQEELMKIARRLEGIALLVETLEEFNVLGEPIRDEVDRLRRVVRPIPKPRTAA